MKARSNKKSNNITDGSDFHRKCHLAYMPQLVKQPRPARPDQTRQRIRPEHYIVVSEDSEQEDAHTVKTKCDDIKQLKYANELQKEDPEQLIESYISSSYYNDPVIEGCDSMKSSAPIKKISFNIPEDKKCHCEDEQMDWNDYHTLGVIYKFMDDLEADFPSLCTTAIIGTSVEGRDLKILKISNSDASNAAVWVDAGIHAREWIAPAVNTYIANQITRNFDSLPESIRNKDWYFLPVVNPDGYEYTHTIDRMWRKNRAWHCGQCVGVDLNRNFSFGWGGKGSSDTPTNAFYKGPRPFSEPESSAIRDVFLKSGINFKVYITLHSYGQIIIFPYACSSNLAPDYVRLLEGATVMSKAIYNTNGNTYKVGISRDVMYGAAGTSNDFAHGAAGIPYCYLIELRIKVAPPIPNTQVWEVKFSRDGQRHFVKTLDTIGGAYNNTFSPWDPVMRLFSQLDADDEIVIKKTSTQILNIVNYKTYRTELRVVSTDEYLKGIIAFFIQFMRAAKRRQTINIWKEERSTMDIMVDGPRAAQVAGLLHEREIPYSIAIPDITTLIEREQGSPLSRTVRKNSTVMRKTMDWISYHRLDTIYSFMDNLVAEYPYLCSVTVIGKSAEGRDLKMLKISNGNENNVGVWLDGTIHPREWISPAVVTFIADRIVRTFNEMSESVTSKDWYILPVMNPDGYEYTHTHDRMWRKNRARFGECIGVDLNRNFSFGFGEKGEEGSSDDPGNVFYRGPKAFSEPETAAVRRVILETPTTFKAFLSFHSYGEVIIFPWGYTSEPCPEYVELLEGGTAMAKAIFRTNGRTYKVGSTKDLMYYAAGTSIDWSYGVANIPYSYMVELRGKTHRFLLPKEEIISTATEVFNGVLKLMDFIDKRCSGSDSCICPK